MGFATGSRMHATARDLMAARRLHAALKEVAGVELPVRLWEGTELGPPQPQFRLVLTTPSAFRSLLAPPRDLSAGQAYISGEIDNEGDMVAALEMAAAIADVEVPWATRLRALWDVIRLRDARSRRGESASKLRGRSHSLSRDRQAIRFHYVGERFLDLGCGWGSLVLHAAREHGVEGVGITLPRQQHTFASERAAAEGLSDRVEFRIADYREVDGEFDAVASIGMYEHVGPDHLGSYFAAMHRLTAEGGRFLNSGITTGRRLCVVD